MRRLVLALLAVAAFCAPARAADPPGLVGRVAVVTGQLSARNAGNTAWTAAPVNYPVAAGEAFWTEPKAQAVLRIGSQTVDLAEQTELEIRRLDPQTM